MGGAERSPNIRDPAMLQRVRVEAAARIARIAPRVKGVTAAPQTTA